MKNTEEYIEFVKEVMAPFGECEFKKMFGSIGIFKDGICFGGVMGNVFRLKVDDTNRADYEKYGMEAWQVPGKKMKMPYYEVPIEIIENQKSLTEWAQKSYDLAVAKKKGKKK